LAASLYPWNCEVYDATDNILLMTTSKYPSLLVKMQKKRHVLEEMASEAYIYAALGDNQAVQEAVVAFHGHSTHLGVAMTCIEREMDDLDDIGLEHVSEALKRSAVHAVSLLSDAGLLHNDLELRNIVQSKDDPDRAKIIDFGRAVFTSDQHLLAEQVKRVKSLLGVQ
jgi:tRNA A-37 threonylcarbamoyl transferase component Bud32